MHSNAVRWLIVVGALVVLPVASSAQEAAVTGTVTDASGAVLPGVTVTAVHEATGNTFVGVSDGQGTYRVVARPGSLRITAELPGFTTVTRTGINLLLGQEAAVDMEMTVTGLQESVTVTGEAPLVEFTSSEVAGNIDPRQMQELPISGRTWTALALLAPGNRTTNMGDDPVEDARADNRDYQINMDGQQVTQLSGTGGGGTRFSRDTIAEFQFISNRFDATQGRSPGVQVNAISKGGTNALSAMFSGSLRNDRFNAKDHVLGIKRPVDIQQYSGTAGGPILRDRLHFFGNFDYEYEPKTSIFNTPYEVFNVTLEGTQSMKIGSGRLDYQFSPRTRLMLRANVSKYWEPFGPGSSNNSPASVGTAAETTTQYLAHFTQVLGNRALNEVRTGYKSWKLRNDNLTTWSNHWSKNLGVTTGSPRITMRGFSVTGNGNYPRYRMNDAYTVRDDFTFSYDARGRHDLKAGAEYIADLDVTTNCSLCSGSIDARARAIPANFDMAAVFPDWRNADTWDLDALSRAGLITRYRVGVPETNWRIHSPLYKYAGWVQDDWRMNERLTINLGLRYDLLWNSFAQQVELLPWVEAGRPQDVNNIQPRVGFAYRLNDRTVVRGGSGIYYSDIILTGLMWAQQQAMSVTIAAVPDGRLDFASNPFNGPLPSFAQAKQLFCHANNGAPGCLIQDTREMAPPAEYGHITSKVHGSIGLQREVTNNLSVQADYVYAHGRQEKMLIDNINVKYDEATGVNLPFSDPRNRVEPLWGIIGIVPMSGRSDYHALQAAFTKRLSSSWQASGTYTLGGYWTGDPPPMSGLRQVTFPVAPDLGGDYSLAPNDQRHRAVFNGIWEVGHGFQVSGLYFFGSGERSDTEVGFSLRDFGGVSPPAGVDRLRQDGTIIPRASFVAEPIHRVDVRLQQRVPIGRLRADVMAEMFNLFNRANFGSWQTDQSAFNFGQPLQNTNIAYAPFTMQLGFRLTF
jgi:hypothetical protein